MASSSHGVQGSVNEMGSREERGRVSDARHSVAAQGGSKNGTDSRGGRSSSGIQTGVSREASSVKGRRWGRARSSHHGWLLGGLAGLHAGGVPVLCRPNRSGGQGVRQAGEQGQGQGDSNQTPARSFDAPPRRPRRAPPRRRHARDPGPRRAPPLPASPAMACAQSLPLKVAPSMDAR